MERISKQINLQILDQVRAGIAVADRDGVLLWANSYYGQITKLNIGEYLGRHVTDLVRESGEELIDTKEATMFDAVLRDRKTVRFVIRYLTSDYIITEASPVFDKAGEICYVVYTLTNYNEVVRAQQELSEAYAKITALQSYQEAEHLQTVVDSAVVYRSSQMERLLGTALRVATMPTPVMLLGESGVGKDVVARFIHKSSGRRKGPFIHVNLGAIPPSLFESELFGYEPGAFTGASRTGKQGLIQLADHGTLFLDEVGELPPDAQAKLLQVVQEKVVRRVGSSKLIPVDFRIVSATNRNLEEMVQNGTFRADLFYRLNVVDVRIPPLRQRTDDILPLVMHYLNHYNAEYQEKKVILPEALDLLTRYNWPGNVRELKHLMERLVAVGRSPIITVSQLPQAIQRPSAAGSIALSKMAGQGGTLKATLEDVEYLLIQKALDEAPSFSAAARALGIDISTLAKKRKRYGL